MKIIISMLKQFKGFYFKIFGLFTLALIISALSLYISIINQSTIDQVFYARNINFLFDYMIYVFIVVYIISIIINVLNSYVTSKVYSEIDSRLKMKYYEKILFSSISFHSIHDSSDIYYRMFKDLSYVIEYCLNLIINIPTNIIYIVLAFVLLFHWSVVLSIVFIGILVVNISIIILIKKPIYSINSQQRIIEQDLVNKINADFIRILTIKVFGIEKFQINKMQKNFLNYIKTNVRNKFLLSILTVLSNISIQMWSLLLVIIGAILVYNHQFTVGEFISFSGVASSTTNITSQIINTISNFQIAKLSYRRFDEYNNQINHYEYSGKSDFKLTHGLYINSLYYKYSNSNSDVLSNLNLELIPGKIVAVIGENGKGKTTLANIIARLLDPLSGTIKIDSENIYNINYTEFRAHVGYVLQRPIIFNDTILNNIVLDKDDISTEKVIKVLSDLGIYDEISSLPLKLNTKIGNNGYQFSVGNIQKVALARVLLRDYKILILDEPTSSLDIESQKKFFSLISQYKIDKNAIILLISHNEVEINIADEKFYL